MNRKTLFLTGANGFVGSNVLSYVLYNTDWDVICPTTSLHHGSQDRIYRVLEDFQENLETVEEMGLKSPDPRHVNERVNLVRCDLSQPFSPSLFGNRYPDYIWNIASESHVDRSLKDPVPFVENNVRLILNTLEYAREVQPKIFLQMSCYDEKTRVWTTEGLKSYEEVQKGDKVLSINPKTKSVEYSEVDRVIVQDYTGSMVRYDGRRIDMMVTPNHRMLIRSNDNKTEFVRADSLASRKFTNLAQLVDHSEAAHGDGLGKIQVSGEGFYDAVDLLYLIGAFIGDGSTNINLEKYSYRTVFHVPWNKSTNDGVARNKIVEILTRLGIKHSVYERAIYIGGKNWTDFFRQFGTRSTDKSFPEWLHRPDFSREELQSLFQGLMDTDGHIFKGNTLDYSTSSEKLASDVLGLAIKLGHTASIRSRKPGEGNKAPDGHTIKGGVNYRVTISLGKQPRNFRPETLETEHYSGKIWCLTIPGNRNMLVERNGKFMFCGNTDEVFGPAPEGYSHHEWDEIKPSNPYSASKAAQESICYSYWRAYNTPLVLTNTMNLIAPGPGYQSSEKFVPKVVKKILDNETVDIHATPEGVSGSRCWIDVRDFAEAWHFLTTKLEDDPNLRYYPNMPDRCIRYNIVGPEASNLEVAQTIARIMGKELNYRMVNFHQSRPGHDPRYSLDGSKLRDFGWTPRRSLDETLRDIVTWYLDNPETLEE